MRWFWITLLYAVLISCAFSVYHSHAASFRPTPLPYSCAQVQWALAHFTREHLEGIAAIAGIKITISQRREVAKCMRGIRYG